MGATIGRTSRRGLLLALSTLMCLALLGGSATAKGKPSVVTLTCPSGVDATATVTLAESVSGPAASAETPISCTSGQTTEVKIKATSQPAPAFLYTIESPPNSCTSAGLRGTGPLECFTGAPTLDVT